MHGVLHAVAAEDARLAPVEFAAELLAFGKQPAAGDPPQPPGDDGAVDLDLQASCPAPGVNRTPRYPKPSLGTS